MCVLVINESIDFFKQRGADRSVSFFCIKQHLFVYRATLKGKLMYQYKFSHYLPLKLFQTRMLSWFVFILFVLCSIQNEKFG